MSKKSHVSLISLLLVVCGCFEQIHSLTMAVLHGRLAGDLLSQLPLLPFNDCMRQC